MSTSTCARMQEAITQLLSDQKKHSIKDIEDYLSESHFGVYRPGHLSSSLNTLKTNGTIKNDGRDRGRDKKCYKMCFWL